MSDEALTRVHMNWPAELKREVRDRVGNREMTTFVLEAVRDRLDGYKELGDVNRLLIEARELAQQLADAVVTGGDREERAAALMELHLPEWIDRTGWPSQMQHRDQTGPDLLQDGGYTGPVEVVLNADACPDCKEPLVAGECWHCFR